MKFNRYISLCLIMLLTSCNGWLTEDNPMTNTPSDYMSSSEAAIQVVNAVYSPMMWEYNDTYYSEFFIGDIVSDDALKGGQNHPVEGEQHKQRPNGQEGVDHTFSYTFSKAAGSLIILIFHGRHLNNGRASCSPKG